MHSALPLTATVHHTINCLADRWGCIAGDWRQAVDYKVTDAQVKLVRSKEVLKKAQKVAAAAEAAAKVKAATPKTALLPPKALAAQWRRQQALKKTGATLKAKSQMLKKKR